MSAALWNLEEPGEFELWDSETGNCVGAYPTLRAALRDVAETVSRYGAASPAVTSLALIRLDAEPGPENGLAGSALIDLAAHAIPTAPATPGTAS